MVRSAFSNVVDVRIGGAKLPTEFARALVDSHVDQGVGVPAAFRLTFRDPYRLLLGKLGVTFGTPVVLAPVADGQGAADPLLTGEVTALEADYDGTGTFTVIRGYDLGHRLLRQRRVAAYRNQSASDIARKLAAQDGVPVGRIESTKTVYEFISQSNVTDWDFLARLADENEMVMSVDADGKFQFVRPKSASGAPSPNTDGDKSPFVLQAGHDILRLRAAVTAADQVGKVESRGWDVTTKKKLTATSPATANPGITIGATPGTAAGKFKTAKLVDTATPYDKQSEVKFAADALADDVTGSFAELEVVARGNPRLRPGVPVALADVGEPFEGKYTVTSVRHVFGDGKHYEVWVTVSGRQWRSLYGLSSGGADTAPRLPSVANALVTDVNDPLKQGRVRLQFPWLDDTYVSDWTRTVQMGGLGGGGIFPMDVNDEVLVAFDRGALDHPFVIGGLYNGKDKPTVVGDVPLHDTVRKKASRHTVSDRDGNRMDLLSQKTGGRKQGVRLTSGDKRLVINLDRTNTEIVVDSKGDVTIKGSRSVSVSAGADLTLTARRNLTIKSGGALSIDSAAMVNVKAGAEIGLAATGALNMSAVGEASLTGGATVQISSAVNTTVKAPTTLVASPVFGVTTIPVPMVIP
ncbi:type IV secretion protein Rhs [Streptomyces bungoensis]|uniref:Type IV secretion protein Rhs n=1 Tax=Streptomyces bungoensis TaxID=285568 RepID=A0A117RBS0_9ACTN|nr:VgrG-related protein [Streptomyces bungoensis]KUN82064.1 type IV secretion protein Rhs [Streptomyces bungoensis]